MTDLDRLLSLEILLFKDKQSIESVDVEDSERQEYQSLYEKIKKTEIQSGDYCIILDLINLRLPINDIERGQIFQIIKQNQKTAEDIEKIKKYDMLIDKQYVTNLETQIQQLKEKLEKIQKSIYITIEEDGFRREPETCVIEIDEILKEKPQ